MNTTKPTKAQERFNASLHERLRQSPLFRTYQDAFRLATGLPLRIVGADPDGWCLDEESCNRSPFCEKLNVCGKACDACIDTNRRLMQEATVKGPSSCRCFAGLSASAVPVSFGTVIVGYLKTGQVFTRQQTERDFQRMLAAIGRKDVSPELAQQLREAYFLTRSIEPERYNSMLTLLQLFAEHLSQLADTLSVIEEGAGSASVARAREYVEKHFRDDFSLADVAREAGMSESHFCRTFRGETGLTLTDYVTRYRVEMAKRELLKPQRRVSEVAFEVGFQSLSQFNRSFARITGISPTRWRQDEMAIAQSASRFVRHGR